jgi:UDP-N-acetylglucosamine--N-acetylmuramyl-(pentapeptide) pyrophosphoryl-undecaprenol N-acetylglucosamine transferase
VIEARKEIRWVVAGGGTGGHVTPALALAERIRGRGESVLFIGSERGLETKLVPEAGIDFVALPAQQLMGRSLLARLGAGPAIAKACAAAWRQIGKSQSDIVLSVGGYAAVPAVIAAWLRRVPIALVEPNAVPGRTNRASARLAKRVFVQFDEAAQVFAAGIARDRIRTPGIPLRLQLIETFRSIPTRRTPAAPFRLLVFGGSQGAHQINETMIEAIPLLDTARIEIFHQTGSADRERVAAAYAEAGVNAEVVEFERDMPSRYAWADLAVCRAGALTVAELTLAALPALFVPYPYAADDHQAANARAMADANAARVLASKTLTAAQLAEQITQLFAAPETLPAMSRAAAKLAHWDAAERIIEDCAALVAAGGRG